MVNLQGLQALGGTLFLSLLRRAHHADQRAIELRSVLRALPDGFSEHQLEVGGEVERVVEYLGRRIVALRDGRVALEAVLARRSGVSAQRALFLAVGMTEGLKYTKV